MCATGLTVCVVLAFYSHGWNRHVWDLKLATLIGGRQVSFVAQVFFALGTALAKLSILASYLRLAPLSSWFRRFTSMCLAPR